LRAIILVGGLGTRLRPLTLNRPKPLLPILNTPFISYQLHLLKSFGVRHVTLAVGRQLSAWKKDLRKAAPKSVKIHLSIEKKPLGTAGAIRLAFKNSSNRFKSKEEEPILILNGDVFIDLNVKKFFRFYHEKKADGALALIKVRDVSHFGWVRKERQGKINQFVEKSPVKRGGWVNAGAYLLSPSLIREIPLRPGSIEREIFPQWLGQKINLVGFPVRGYWNDIGTPQTYLKAHRDLLGRPPPPGQKANICVKGESP